MDRSFVVDRDREVYYPVAPGALYEIEYQRTLLSLADVLFPAYWAIEFSPLVFTEDSAARPDIALIDKMYRHWWVVEVESIRHSLHNHVLPQIRTLRNAYYGREQVDYIVRRRSDLARYRLEAMISSDPPKLLVIVDSPNGLEWTPDVNQENAELLVVELYRNRFNQTAASMTGSIWSAESSILSRCFVDRRLPNFLHVISPGALEVHQGESILMQVGPGTSLWTRVDTADKVWLVARGHSPPLSMGYYKLFQLDTGLLRLVDEEGN